MSHAGPGVPTDPDLFVGKNIREILSDGAGEGLVRSAELALQSRTAQTLEYQRLVGDTKRFFEARIVRFRDNEIIALSRDISERKRAEQELMRSKQIAESALKAREDFFARMSHEIRTPMNGIIGLTNLLGQSELNLEQEELLKSLRLSSQNLLVIINDILDLAKAAAGKMKFSAVDFSFSDVMQNIVKSCIPTADGKGLALNATVDVRIPRLVVGDPVRLTQVLTNLVTNAIKFTEHGSVTMAASLASEHNGEVMVECVVRDTGIGIPSERIPELFDRFSQIQNPLSSRYNGTGLGLAIVKQLVELQGGTVGVESTVGSGSAFRIRLPFAVSKKTRLEEAPTEHFNSLAPLHGVRVLVAEDNAINQQVISRTLALWGAHAIIANDGGVAIEAVNRDRFDLVLMDIQMPEMDGFDVTKYIRAAGPEHAKTLPIIAMTASVMFNAEQRCLEAGMDDYISKPFDPRVLHEKISRLLHRPAPAEVQLPGVELMADRQESAVDLSYFRSISRGDEHFVRKSIAMYIGQLEQFLVKLREAEDLGNWKAVASIAHTMKPALKMIGQMDIADTLSTIEQRALSEPDAGALLDLLADVEATCQVILEELKQTNPDPQESVTR
jgi:signal transduction histidine kinase/CheY-like chemotaxis protein/HPt (histidine-containing phosphotransfer) domain-containing protein